MPEPISPDLVEKMTDLARDIDGYFNGGLRGRDRKIGFVLMVYPFNDEGRTDGRCNYISNGADRNDITVLMREMIARFEGQPEMKGRA